MTFRPGGVVTIKQYTCWICGYKLYGNDGIRSEDSGKWMCRSNYQCLQRMTRKQ